MGHSGVTPTASAMYARSIDSSWMISIPRPPSTNEGRSIKG